MGQRQKTGTNTMLANVFVFGASMMMQKGGDQAKTPQKAVTRQSELDAGRIEEDFCRVVGCGSQKTLLPLALHFGTLNPSRLV